MQTAHLTKQVKREPSEQVSLVINANFANFPRFTGGKPLSTPDLSETILYYISCLLCKNSRKSITMTMNQLAIYTLSAQCSVFLLYFTW